jgi:hypothetical protein
MRNNLKIENTWRWWRGWKNMPGFTLLYIFLNLWVMGFGVFVFISGLRDFRFFLIIAGSIFIVLYANLILWQFRHVKKIQSDGKTLSIETYLQKVNFKISELVETKVSYGRGPARIRIFDEQGNVVKFLLGTLPNTDSSDLYRLIEFLKSKEVPIKESFSCFKPQQNYYSDVDQKSDAKMKSMRENSKD